MSSKLSELFSPHGPLSRAVKGYQHRASQTKMAEQVAHTFEKGGVALIEAGTGTGKSMAYLAPALVAAQKQGTRTVVATHTINLQEQLIHKDFPNLSEVIAPEATAVLVKGMGNYLCLRRLADARQEQATLASDVVEELDQLDHWAGETEDGSMTELPTVPSHGIWERVAAEGDTCSHMRCPFYNQCFFFRARKQAEQADVLVVNHHLLMADLRARQEDGALLPDYDQLVVDEAHHLEDVATEALAWRATRRQLARWLHLLGGEGVAVGGKLGLLRDKLRQVNLDDRELLLNLESDLPSEKNQVLAQVNGCFRELGELADGNERRLRLSEEHRMSPVWREQVEPAVTELVAALNRFAAGLQGMLDRVKQQADVALQSKTDSVRQDIEALGKRLERSAERLEHFVMGPLNPEDVRWIEVSGRGGNVQLVEAQLDVSEVLREQLFQAVPATVLTSATLTAGGAFTFLRQRLGLVECEVFEAVHESPFDFAKQAGFYVANDLAAPNAQPFAEQVSRSIVELVKASRGDTFVLFTSYQMLRTCYEAVAGKLNAAGYPSLRQGDQARQKLLDQFRSTPGAVLFGTDSFWEGVDVAGDALRCVIVTKLPFKVPTEPLVQARLEALEAAGQNPFAHYSLPQAVLKFKQGFGRLIRSPEDSGVVVCLDHRIVTRSYGKVFVKSLPACPVTEAPVATLASRLRSLY